jgi:hypothetical protein
VKCADCALWLRGRWVVFPSAARFEPAAPGESEGVCRGPLAGRIVEADFGCVGFRQLASPAEQEERVVHAGEPWQVWEMIACPDCGGRGSTAGEPPADGGEVSSSACYRCAGTGNVRRYADGFIGDERTREHPVEREIRKRETEQLLREKLAAELAALDQPPGAPAAATGASSLGFT